MKLEIIGGEELAVLSVALEHLPLVVGEGGAEDMEIGLVVEEEGAVVEVGGADD